MSWLAASLIVLGLALVAGFAWYERSHPSARVLALVATLAALAALGRIAFAPLPNVKPTTDIVLLTGYALGGAPGFAVGAVAALASNVFFGQGPWTPWQMCAWGGIGVGGALLARAFGRELGRVSLAVACGLAGAFFGAVMNLSLWVTYSGDDHSLAKLGAYFVTSLPFDIAHVVGNVAFCLLFGPALVRALTRYRQRFEITWRPAPALAASVLGALVLLAAAPRPAEAAPPLAWLQSAQNADGGFGGDAGQRSSGLYTGWAGLGFAAAGRNPRDVKRGGSDIVAYVRAHPKDISDLGEVSRTILLLRAAGVKPRVGSRDLVKELLSKRRPSGSFANRVNTTSFAIFALRATSRSRDDRVIRSAARWIAGQANGDGGFNFAGKGAASGIDDTGAALQALVAAGRRKTPTARRAARFIARRQNPDGGYPLQPGGGSNAQSTAWAIQALVAVGRNPDRQRRNGAKSPVAYLRSLVTASGKVRYSRTSAQTPVWATAQALAALARKPFPLAPVPRAKTTVKPAATPAPTAAPAPKQATPAAPKPVKPTPRPAAEGPVGPPTPADLAPMLQEAARAAGYLTGALVAPVA